MEARPRKVTDATPSAHQAAREIFQERYQTAREIFRERHQAVREIFRERYQTARDLVLSLMERKI